MKKKLSERFALGLMFKGFSPLGDGGGEGGEGGVGGVGAGFVYVQILETMFFWQEALSGQSLSALHLYSQYFLPSPWFMVQAAVRPEVYGQSESEEQSGAQYEP
jgi:hypothetical protein